MPNFLVRWMIEIDTTAPIEAAREALSIQRDPVSRATVFDVVELDDQLNPVGDWHKDIDPEP